MRDMEIVMAELFLEHQLRERARWAYDQARWNFVQHHRSSGSGAHRRWKKRRAAGRY